MQFIVKAYDGEGMLDKRMEVRPRHGKCCACVAHHRKIGKLPHCLREQEG